MASETKIGERDCRSCRHNSYAHLTQVDYFDCSHPVTLAKDVRWAKGDPAMVNWRTSDVRFSEIHQFADCPTYEALSAPEKAGEEVDHG